MNECSQGAYDQNARSVENDSQHPWIYFEHEHVNSKTIDIEKW